MVALIQKEPRFGLQRAAAFSDWLTNASPVRTQRLQLQFRGVEAGEGEEGTMSDIELLSEASPQT